ncbi:MAG: formimidoylglutamate deiminase [Alphaproteobacteria bacterium]|nr:formimidoylglutamate deiminase [Alphaproteobacteria bacterium]
MPVRPEESLFAERALLPDGWARNVLIRYDPTDGSILGVVPDAAPGGDHSAGIAVPGMPNLHSHAFQRAMAGRAERAGGTDDSFWTWRQTMYELVSRLDPDQIGAIAAQLYAELLCEGYTSVAEFHYLHNRPDGGRYDNPAETALRVVRAAKETGIGMTLLPVLYSRGGFNDEALNPAQQRFRGDPGFLSAVGDAVVGASGQAAWLQVGLAVHSLRAAAAPHIREATQDMVSRNPDAPIHIHVAEQVREVSECFEWSGATPVEWLLDNAPVGETWCLVHATNVSEAEVSGMASRGAVVGLCPTTEANLGDGLFPLRHFLDRGGRFGIGSDSHVSVSPVEELRWLEYGQRLVARRRAVAASEGSPSVGTTLWRGALAGGAQALGQAVGAIRENHRADILVLDHEHPRLDGRQGDDILDALVFTGSGGLIRRVLAGGSWVVEDGRHIRAEATAAAYREVIRALY